MISKHMEFSQTKCTILWYPIFYSPPVSPDSKFRISFVVKIPPMNSDEFKCPQMSHDLSSTIVELDCGFVVHVVKFVHIFSRLFNTFSCLFWHVLFLAF